MNHLPGGASLQDLAIGGFGEAGFEGVWVGLGFAGLGRRQRPWPARVVILLGRRRQHGLLGRPGRGPLTRVHDTALPVRRLPVPGPARACSPGDRRSWPVPGARRSGRLYCWPPLRRAGHVRPAANRGRGAAVGHRGGGRAVRRGHQLPARGPLRPRGPCARARLSGAPMALDTLPFFALAQVVDAGDIVRTPSDLREATVPYIDNIYRIIKGSGSLITLTDEDGVVLDVLSDDDVRGMENFPPGTIHSERPSARAASAPRCYRRAAADPGGGALAAAQSRLVVQLRRHPQDGGSSAVSASPARPQRRTSIPSA